MYKVQNTLEKHLLSIVIIHFPSIPMSTVTFSKSIRVVSQIRIRPFIMGFTSCVIRIVVPAITYSTYIFGVSLIDKYSRLSNYRALSVHIQSTLQLPGTIGTYTVDSPITGHYRYIYSRLSNYRALSVHIQSTLQLPGTIGTYTVDSPITGHYRYIYSRLSNYRAQSVQIQSALQLPGTIGTYTVDSPITGHYRYIYSRLSNYRAISVHIQSTLQLLGTIGT